MGILLTLLVIGVVLYTQPQLTITIARILVTFLTLFYIFLFSGVVFLYILVKENIVEPIMHSMKGR